jgi:hypothetical protein
VGSVCVQYSVSQWVLKFGEGNAVVSYAEVVAVRLL